MGDNSLPRKSDHLFKATRRVPDDGTRAEASWPRFAEAYRQAADQLADWLAATSNRGLIMYPLLFLYRHYIELGLKGCVELAIIRERVVRGTDDSTSVALKSHSLTELLGTLRTYCEQDDMMRNPAFACSFKSFSKCIEELVSLDPTSMVTRYPLDNKKMVPTLDKLPTVDPQNLCDVIGRMANLLSLLRTHFEDGIQTVEDNYGWDDKDWEFDMKDVTGADEWEGEMEALDE